MQKLKILNRYLSSLTEEDIDAILFIVTALKYSKVKHPHFAKDSLSYGVNILTEEVGELAQAVNQWQYEDGKDSPMLTEASHVGAVAIRLVAMISELLMPTTKPKDSTVALINTIIDWEKNLGEYNSLENKLRSMYEIKKRK